MKGLKEIEKVISEISKMSISDFAKFYDSIDNESDCCGFLLEDEIVKTSIEYNVDGFIGISFLNAYSSKNSEITFLQPCNVSGSVFHSSNDDMPLAA